MSDQLFDIVFENKRITKEFYNRKDSIAIEINELFSGCVIYIDKINQAKSYFVIRAYCAHTNCRKYYLRAYYTNLKTFEISVSSPNIIHLQPLTRQVRRYERQKKQEKLLKDFAVSVRENDVIATNKGVIKLGNFQGVASIEVYDKIRQEALSQQDKDIDDLEDVIKMQTTDRNTNFISEVLDRKNPGVYIRSKSQHDILHKLHIKREIDGTPIVLRMDASGGIARDIDNHKILYHALAVNTSIDLDKSSTSLPLTEQYNCRNTSKDIAKWLFDFELGHSEYYEDHPVLADYIVSDFSYANFHAVLKAFNGITLANYLNLAYSWLHEIKFPTQFYHLVKIKMCYTHLMKTFAEMLRRLYGKPSKIKQHKHCRVIMEILGSIIKAEDYEIVLKLWKQLVILMNTEFVNEDVKIALVKVAKILIPIDWTTEEFEADSSIVDIEELPENESTLYKNNLFYIEFERHTHRDYFQNNSDTKNVYYNPTFLNKFLKRFVPLIPCWTNILWKSSMKPSVASNPMLLNLQDQHPQNETNISSSILCTSPTSDHLHDRHLDEQNLNPSGLSQQSSNGLSQQSSNGSEEFYSREKLQAIHLLNDGHNQPIECHFGKFKRRLAQHAVHLGYPPVKLGRAIVESRKMIDATIETINSVIPKQRLNTQKPRKKYTRTKPLSTKNSKKLTTKENEIDPISFSQAKENYSKNHKPAQLTYMKLHSVSKIAKAQVQSQPKGSIHVYKNGLSKSAKFYRDMAFEFVVAKNTDNTYLYNFDFDLLHQQKEMSEPLMEYVTSQFRKDGVQVEFLRTDDTLKIKFIENTIFVLVFMNSWTIFIVDKVNKIYYLINPNGDNDEDELRYLFLRRMTVPKTFKEKKFTTTATNDDFNSGVFCYCYMKMYINTDAISNRKISPDVVRSEVEQSLIKNSVDMTESCLICGSDSNDIDSNWGECTKCERWVHCVCGQVTLEQVEADENFMCKLCSGKFFAYL